MNVKGVFFDLYGTLLIYGDMVTAWDEWTSFIHCSFVNRGLDIGRAALEPYVDGFFSEPEPPASENDELTLYERRIAALGHQLNLDLTTDDLRKISKGSIKSWAKHTHLDPDAKPLLQELKSIKTLALISNFDHPPHVHAQLKEFGLDDIFDTVIVSGEVGIDKPDTKIFSLALEHTNLQAQEVAYIGDMIKEDIQGSKSAGMSPILIDRERNETSGHTLDDGTPVITSLTELKQLIR